MKRLKKATRYDSGADPGFFRRVQAAFATAGQVEQTIVGTETMSGADAARLRMLDRMGLLKDSSSAADARRRMIARRERKSE